MQYQKFEYITTIKKEHLDMFQHVNNASYLVLLEAARWDLITKNGYSIQKIQETQLAPTILEIKIAFKKELKFNDIILIETQMTFHKNKIGILSQKMFRENELCCEAELTIGLFDLKERKLVLPTQDWLHAVGIID